MSGFSALQRAENSSIHYVRDRLPELVAVSVLFSEPKIPQFKTASGIILVEERFSALQRAENSSIVGGRAMGFYYPGFSALQRAENSSIRDLDARASSCIGFSALQRAENSSIKQTNRTRSEACEFQCSSASRKFLNTFFGLLSELDSIKFQCSSASRKFLNDRSDQWVEGLLTFQCSSASRKFLNQKLCRVAVECAIVSVLFSEPKIPQLMNSIPGTGYIAFQCSSASRKFLNG